MGDTEPRPGVGIHQALVAGMHTRGNVLRLSGLVRTSIVAVEGLENKCSQVEGVDGEMRGLLYGVPARSKLGRCILCRVRY